VLPHSTAVFTQWDVISTVEAHGLENARFYDGHPQEEAELVPDESSKQRSVWRFVKNDKRRIWLTCSYKATTLVLARQLPASVTQCVVNHRRREADAPLGVQCD